MDINELYSSISGFWDSIAPVFIAHLIAIFAFRWIGGIRFDILSKLEALLQKDIYKRWRKLFDEFEQRSKIPYLVIIFLLIYLVVFRSSLNVLTIFEPIKITYSEYEFWEENRPIQDLSEVGAFGNDKEIRMWEIAYLKNNFLEKYRDLYPNRYQSSVSWHSREYGKWFTYYKLSIVFLIFSLIVAVYQIRKSRFRITLLLRLLLLILFSLLSIGLTRYKSEQYIESRLKAELTFVTTQLNVDLEIRDTKLSEEEIETIKVNLFQELKVVDRSTFHDRRWFSRYLEQYSIGTRSFPYVTDDEFYDEFHYLEDELSSP